MPCPEHKTTQYKPSFLKKDNQGCKLQIIIFGVIPVGMAMDVIVFDSSNLRGLTHVSSPLCSHQLRKNRKFSLKKPTFCTKDIPLSILGSSVRQRRKREIMGWNETVKNAEKLVEKAMKGNDASHDAAHVWRVRDLALSLACEEGLSSNPHSMQIVIPIKYFPF